MMWRFLSFTTISYTVFVEINNQYNKQMQLKKPVLVGSADDMIFNQLKTGDLVLFKRRWFALAYTPEDS